MIKLNKLLLVLILGLSVLPFYISANVIKSNYLLVINDLLGGGDAQKKETDREKTIRLLDYMDKIEDAIVLFDKDIYNQYMNLLKIDTGFQFTFKCHYEAYLVLNRCMNEGNHKFDINVDEYDQLDSIAYSPLTNASAFARLYLMGYDAYKEDLERRLSIEGKSENDKFFKIYPNPASNMLMLEFSNKSYVGQNYIYSIYNIDSKLVKSSTLHNSSIDISELQSGVYTFQINTLTETYSQSFVVAK